MPALTVTSQGKQSVGALQAAGKIRPFAVMQNWTVQLAEETSRGGVLATLYHAETFGTTGETTRQPGIRAAC